jgi:hypothetical protein
MFAPGHRVRLGEKRGGWVVQLPRRRFRAVFPDLSVEYVDHCEPDEDGGQWLKGRCASCSQEHRRWNDSLCVNCGEAPEPAPLWLKTWLRDQWKG